MDEKKKKIINITKPEDIDNVKLGQWMHFMCKNCGEDILLKFATFKRIDRYKRILCKKCNLSKMVSETTVIKRSEKIKKSHAKLKNGVPIISSNKEYNAIPYGVKYIKICANCGNEFSRIKRNKNFRSLCQYCAHHTDGFKDTQRIHALEAIKSDPMFLSNLKDKNRLYWNKLCNREKMSNCAIEHNFVANLQTESSRIKVRESMQRILDDPEKRTELHKSRINNIKINKLRYNGLLFDSSWELYYYIYQTEILKNNNCVRNNGDVYFEYSVCGKHYRYYPDFINNNKIVEIKGDHLIDLNDKTLIKIYKNQNKRVLLAKTQCMFDNVDEIITNKEITPMIKEVKRLFGTHYIDQFKVNKNEEGLKAS